MALDKFFQMETVVLVLAYMLIPTVIAEHGRLQHQCVVRDARWWTSTTATTSAMSTTVPTGVLPRRARTT